MIEVEAPEEYICPLTLDVMKDPVMSKYGQSFERSEILQWLRAGHGVCPLSRRPLSLQDLVTNHALRMKISDWRKENGDDNVVVVTPPTPAQIFGYITLPTKDEGTDRTIDEEEDLFYLQLAVLRLGQQRLDLQQQEQQQQSSSSTTTSGRRRRRQQRRASTGSQSGRESQHRSIRRPLRGLRNFFAGPSINV